MSTELPPLRARNPVSRNPFFALYADQLEPQPGAPTYTYHHIECAHDAVVVVPVLDDGRVVLERIYRHPYREYLHEFPAGGIAPGEDPAAAAARELGEETGYRAAAVHLLGSYEPLPGLVRMRLHVAVATGLQPGAERALETLELLELTSMQPETVDALIAEGAVSGFLVTPWLWYRGSEASNAGG